MSPILSIVVPVFNVSRYLREGMDSLLNQEVEDVEIICVDDCSTDDSRQILEEYVKRDGRISIVSHEKNEGLPTARNTGFEKASGKYVAFFDPDDQVYSNMYRRLIEVAEKYQLEVVQCGFRHIPDMTVSVTGLVCNRVVTPCELISQTKTLHSKTEFSFSWRFLFLRKHLVDKKLFFNEKMRMGQDGPFNFEAVMSASQVFYIAEPLYLYRTDNYSSIGKTKYKWYQEEALQLQIAEKKRICKEYHVDEYTPYTIDMSEDIIKRYTTMFFANIKNNPNGEDLLKGVKRILCMPMVQEAMDVVGYRNIYSNWKEYIFYLCMKWHLFRLVAFVIQKH